MNAGSGPAGKGSRRPCPGLWFSSAPSDITPASRTPTPSNAAGARSLGGAGFHVAVCAREATCHLPAHTDVSSNVQDDPHSRKVFDLSGGNTLGLTVGGGGTRVGRRQESCGDSGFAETVQLQMKSQTQSTRYRGTNDLPTRVSFADLRPSHVIKSII